VLDSGKGPQTTSRRTIVADATLADRFDPAANSLGVLRLGLAVVVAVSHALALATGNQPNLRSTLIGELAVDAFFVISGFLVARSYLRLGSLRRFAWHRFLRIMPAYWVCLLLTAFVAAPLAALITGRDTRPLFTAEGETAQGYVLDNSVLLMGQFGIAGLPAGGTLEPGVWNGSLWTLFYEACCYALLAGLGAAGVLGRRRWALLVALGGTWAVVTAQAAGLAVVPTEILPGFVLMFLLGAAGHVLARWVPIGALPAAASLVVVLVVMLLLTDYRPLGAVPFAYLCLWAVVRLPVRRDVAWDLSYGVYIYHWPIQQLALMAGAESLSPPAFVAMTLAISAAVAALSWVSTERPALACKNAAWVTGPFPFRIRRRATPAPRRSG
jgi:peptidoglycan/LPS O-acetylase OafA/YrhL